MTKESIVYSFDDGYEDNKLCPNESKIIRIPNALSGYMEKNETTFLSNKKNYDIDKYYDPSYDYILSDIGGQKFTIGKYVQDYDLDFNWFGGDNKHADPKFHYMFSSLLGLMSSSNFTEVDMLVMGLPCSSMNKDRIDRLKRIATQYPHRSNILLANGMRLPREVKINQIEVKEQPFGSACYLLLDKDGDVNPSNADISEGMVVVIDIGGKTDNIYTLDDMTPNAQLSKHSNLGMYHSYLKVHQYLTNDKKIDIGTGKISTIIKAGYINDIDLSDIIDYLYKEHASLIFNKFDTMFSGKKGYVKRIIFTGGGSTLLKEYLEKLFNGYNVTFLDRYANSIGLRRYGLMKIKNSKKTLQIAK